MSRSCLTPVPKDWKNPNSNDMDNRKNAGDRERSHNPDMDERLHKPVNPKKMGDRSREGTEEAIEPKPPVPPDENWNAEENRSGRGK